MGAAFAMLICAPSGTSKSRQSGRTPTDRKKGLTRGREALALRYARRGSNPRPPGSKPGHNHDKLLILQEFSSMSAGDPLKSSLSSDIDGLILRTVLSEGSRMSPPILRLCSHTQPRREEPHATASECTAWFQPYQATATKVSYASIRIAAYAPRSCHVSESEPL